jgi:hypothetical protein
MAKMRNVCKTWLAKICQLCTCGATLTNVSKPCFATVAHIRMHVAANGANVWHDRLVALNASRPTPNPEVQKN